MMIEKEHKLKKYVDIVNLKECGVDILQTPELVIDKTIENAGKNSLL